MTRARQDGVEEVSLIQTYLSSSLSLSSLCRPSKREPISSVSPLLSKTCQFIARSRNNRFLFFRSNFLLIDIVQGSSEN